MFSSIYLPGRGGTMIKKVVLPGRGLAIAPCVCWPLWFPQMRETWRHNFWWWGTEFMLFFFFKGFPDSPVGNESICNTGDPGLIPGLGRPTKEEIGCPLQYSWASMVAELVKNLPEMLETWVWSLGWEDPLEKGKVTHSSILAWRIPWNI